MVKVVTSVLLFSVLTLAVTLAAITYIALESGGVTSVWTNRHDGDGDRETHIWFVQIDNKLFLEAGHPENPWVRDLEPGSTLTLVGGNIDGTYAFQVIDDHRRIRSLMREKYGWRDQWIGLLFDVSQSQMIELGPPPSR